MKALSEELLKDYQERAAAEREAGGSIEVNHRLPYVGLTLSDGAEYYFQGEAAEKLLAEVPENIDDEDFILAVAQNW